MLLEFTVGNYLSFKDKKTLSIEASSISEFPQNVITAGDYKVLRSVVIYGANSSGKSNLLKALTTMFDIIKISAERSSTAEIEVTPFLLNTETENQPSYFEILFLIDGVRYRYGFEVSRKKVHYEWLYEKKTYHSTEKNLFIRENDTFELSKEFEEGKGLESKTRANALFLSVCDQFNGIISKKIMTWFDDPIELSGIEHKDNRNLTIRCIEIGILKADVQQFIKSLNLGFSKISLSDNQKEIMTFHNKYDKEKNIISEQKFNSREQESSGSNKILDLAGYISLSLYAGCVTVIDELDAKLHPLLTKEIVKMYNSPQINKKNAQLIFATHDTNLLNYADLRRDQIYFTEKNQYEESDLYSLVEFKDSEGNKTRKDRNYEKDYIAGRYGAIPFIGNFQNLMENGTNE
jgi:AAA15 family ATPase/GTPase